MRIKFWLNKRLYERQVDDNKTLLRFLREDLGFTGTKEGCGVGECGACTIIMNGQSINACMVLAAECDKVQIETIEGEAKDSRLSAIQDAFDKHHAVQCGFCTPGMVMSVRDLLARNPKPTIDEIKEGIEGNFCRCTGYLQIIEAVQDLSGQSTKSHLEGLKNA